MGEKDGVRRMGEKDELSSSKQYPSEGRLFAGAFYSPGKLCVT